MRMSAAKDHWIKCVSKEGGIRAVAIHAKGLVGEAVRRHKLTDAGIRALGEALIGGLFFASYSKGKDRINLKVNGSKSLAYAFVDSYPDGTVRGYVVEKPVPAGAVTVPSGVSSHHGPWGEGLISILWTKALSEREKGTPFVGSVPLVTGHFAKDLTYYWVQSEQVPTAIGIDVKVKRGKVLSATGFMIQTLGGASDEEISRMEFALSRLKEFQTEFESDPDPMRILELLFGPKAFKVAQRKPVRFKCQCSKARVTRALHLLPAEDLTDMIQREKKAVVNCDFCGEVYKLSRPELVKILKAVERGPGKRNL